MVVTYVSVSLILFDDGLHIYECLVEFLEYVIFGNEVAILFKQLKNFVNSSIFCSPYFEFSFGKLQKRNKAALKLKVYEAIILRKIKDTIKLNENSVQSQSLLTNKKIRENT